MTSTRIAGKNQANAWKKLSDELKAAPTDALWERAHKDFYYERIKTRYLDPIEAIEKAGDTMGSGFAITALFSTLIEFFGSTETGFNFKKYPNRAVHEYGIRDAKDFFKYCLEECEPFKSHIPKAQVMNFYAHIRCGLLHDARTGGGWVIRAKGAAEPFISVNGTEVVLNRSRVYPLLTEYLEGYRKRLLADQKLKDAFLRKFDFLSSQ